jgi:GR25 family glycosyltransferase involved in LPS biosynthesis
MHIFLNNLSEIAINKVFNILLNNDNQSYMYISSIFTNVDYNKTLTLNDSIPICYIKNIPDMYNLIIDKNIKIFISNTIDGELFNRINNICSYVTLVNLNIPNIIFYKKLNDIICKYIDGDNCKKIITSNSVGTNQNQTNNSQNANNLSENNKLDSDPKEKYRKLCLKYLENIRKITIPELHLNLEKEAVLVEYRILPHLEVLLRNMIYNLGNTWSYTIVCGNRNFELIDTICKNISTNIRIIKTDNDNKTQNDYNNWLCLEEFWDLFVGKKLLIYQEDTCIFKKNIDDFLEYDYIGSAFGAQCVTPINVGNGGFSLRTKSIMKEIIKKCPAINFKSTLNFINYYKRATNLDLYPEDNYFPQCMQDYSIGKIAPYDVARKFGSEQVFTDDCLGMHIMWICNKNWEKYITDYFESIVVSQNDIKINNTNLYDHEKSNISHKKHTFDIYFIHCKDFVDRENIINKAIEHLNYEGSHNINIIDSVNTSKEDLTLENQEKILKKCDENLKFNNKEKWKFWKGGQIGCYIGHHIAIKTIMEKKTSNNYSIIFEDDLILNNDFTNSVSEIVNYFEENNEEFDLIYLGSLNKNNGIKKHNNIYSLNKLNWCFGTHGLLINNKSAPKLYKLNCNILQEIDCHYKLLFNQDLIKAYYIDKPLLSQNRQIFSHINLKENNF